jgi:ATP-binding cassette subfamily C (CFTR/MRP) protein 1
VVARQVRSEQACQWTTTDYNNYFSIKNFNWITLIRSSLAQLTSSVFSYACRNPTGRILNRFSDDQDKVDNYVAMAVGSIFATCFSTCGSLITILVITRYLGLIVLPIACIYFCLMVTYLTVGREVQRLQSTSKSPFLSLLSESVDGLAQLRSFGFDAVRRCIQRNEAMVDDYCRATYALTSANAW